jgi:type II secretory ATPase GspE/PulE/Tfp pilus assembly ATPase PilB-like protein
MTKSINGPVHARESQEKAFQHRDVVALLSLSGHFAAEEVQQLVQRTRASKMPFWDVLLQEKNITEDKIADLFAQRLKIQRICMANETLDPSLDIIPEQMARKNTYLPLALLDRKIVLCMANPVDMDAIREVEFLTGFSVSPVVSTRSEILDAINRFYADAHGLKSLLKNAVESQELRVVQPEPVAVELDDVKSLEEAQQAPVVQLVNLILQGALREFASDVHIEGHETEVQVRYRVDGLLRDRMQIPKSLQAGITSRIKVLSGLDISEKRRPQDGHLCVTFQQKRVDLRVSTLPNRSGEKIVMRVLGSGKAIPTLNQLGMEASDLELLQHAISQSQGMILVTGPTGSGKTTSLYSALSAKRSKELNVITIEDPIEFHLPGVTQVQIATKAGLTFGSTLRSVLRQDPDVILVGEIRDEETAEIAFHAAMTGHLVLSSLHTNSALATIHRLLKLGIEPFLVGSSVNLVIAQRLVRTVCQNCATTYKPSMKLLARLGLNGQEGEFHRGKGCGKCGGSGYAGRLGLYEVLAFTPAVQEAIDQNLTGESLLEVARSAGMRPLLEDGLEKIKKGITTVEEVLRVVSVGEQAVIPCPDCGAPTRSNFLSCPFCLASLRKICRSCNQELESGWKICPYCAQPSDSGENLSGIVGKGNFRGFSSQLFQ